MLVLKSGNLPDGQKHPSMQWSSHTWLLLGLLQVSVQGLPHSLYSMLKGHVFAIRNNDSDVNTVKTSKRDHVNALTAVLTTQLCSLPLLWFPACMSTLMGVLWYGWTQAWRIAAVAVAQVFHTGFDEVVCINPVLTAEECRSWQQVLTQVCLWVKLYVVFKLHRDVKYIII